MFSERIRNLRLAWRLSQVEFGNRLGVTKQCVSNWENNNIQPSVDMIIRIARVFSVSSDYLLGISQQKTLDVSDLELSTVSHLQQVIDDLRAASARV